jgi:hypothetical protein
VTSENTFVYALALGVLVNAGLAWIICSTIAKALEQRLSTIGSNLSARATLIGRAVENAKTQLAELERHSPKKLSAEVAALSEAVASLNDTHRRFAGKVWQRITKDERQPELDGSGGDAELAAMLALQRQATTQ